MKYDPDLSLPSSRPLDMFRIDCWGKRLCCPDQPARDYRKLLQHALAKHHSDHPVIVMVHGETFSPHSMRNNAQKTLFARHIMPKNWQSRAWPVRFASSNIPACACLAIGWGWHAQGSDFNKISNMKDIFATAQDCVKHFAAFIHDLSDQLETRKIHIICEGVGAHIVIQSLRLVQKSNIRRIIINDGHTFNAKTLLALNRAAAHDVEFYNLVDHKKLKSTRWLNAVLPRSGPKDTLIAQGFLFERSNWVDIPLNTPKTNHMFPDIVHSTLPFTWPRIETSHCLNRFIKTILHNTPKTNIANIQHMVSNTQMKPMIINNRLSHPLNNPRSLAGTVP